MHTEPSSILAEHGRKKALCGKLDDKGVSSAAEPLPSEEERFVGPLELIVARSVRIAPDSPAPRNRHADESGDYRQVARSHERSTH